MSMTVIFSDLGDADCGTLPLLWRGIPDANVLQLTRTSKYTREDIRAAIQGESDTLLICGHGTPNGLLGYAASPVRRESAPRYNVSGRSQADQLREAYGKAKGDSVGAIGLLPEEDEIHEYYATNNVMGTVVDGTMAKDFHADRVICIWCHASDFARKHNLYGFWSSMFISNSMEARYCGFPGVPNEVILAECRKFMRDVNLLIRKDVPQDEWIDKIMAVGDLDYPTTAYNYEGLCYFPKH